MKESTGSDSVKKTWRREQRQKVEGEWQKESKEQETKIQTIKDIKKYILGKLDRNIDLSDFEEFKIWYGKG